MIDFDVIQALFWSLTYILIIIHNAKYKQSGIPPFSIVLNFAWETYAITKDIQKDFFSWIHVIWFFLDAIIIITYFIFCEKIYYEKWINIPIYVLTLAVLFLINDNTNNGTLISCFIIDILMATEWCVYVSFINKKNTILLLLICFAKLIGDLFAWLYYKQYSIVVFIIGIIVLFINSICLIVAIYKLIRTKTKKDLRIV